MKAYDMDIEKNLENFEEDDSLNCLFKSGSSMTKNITDMDTFYDICINGDKFFNFVNGGSSNKKSDPLVWDFESISISSSEISAKKSLFDINIDKNEKIDLTGWTNKPKEEWTKTDTINWIITVGSTMGHSFGRMSPRLALPGKELLLLSRQQFAMYDRDCGEKLYDYLHNDRRDSTEYRSPLYGYTTDSESDTSSVLYSDSDTEDDRYPVKNKKPIASNRELKKKPGRPPLPYRKTKEPRKKLWEFIRDALLNPELCPRLICWDVYEEKTFKIVNTAKLAELWGERNKKENSTMNYEKFSRAMRYYYKKGIFKSVPGRRLIYQFGDEATGLETDCPNFDPDYYVNKIKSEY